MRFTVSLCSLLAVISSTFAILFDRQNNLPSCAVACLASANTGSCSATNETCLCTNQVFVNTALACMKSTCSSTDLQSAEAAAQQLCISQAGVTLTVSSATPTTSATGSAAPTASHSGDVPMIPASINVLAGVAAALAIAAVL